MPTKQFRIINKGKGPLIITKDNLQEVSPFPDGLASHPLNPIEGVRYFNTVAKTEYIYAPGNTSSDVDGWLDLGSTIPQSGNTSLSQGARTANTVKVDSSTGLSATLTEATNLLAGVLSAAKFNEIAANTLELLTYRADWNTAYSWGNHALAGYLTSLPFVDNSIDWNNAYSWGDHALAGYLTSLPFVDNSVNWNTAFGWGDHALAGYLTNLPFADNSTNWNTAYSWGNHALAGYLTSVPSHTHVINDIALLQAALDAKVDDGQVLTNVPAGAVFTDTIYTLPFTDNSVNWNTAYAKRINSFTTIGTDGPATLINNVLNIPVYSLSGLGAQPLDEDLTAIANLNGNIGILTKTAINTWELDTNNYALASSLHNILTIGTNANGLSLGTYPSQVLSLGLASASTNGALSSTDWNTFNNKASVGDFILNQDDFEQDANMWINGTIRALNVLINRAPTSNFDATNKIYVDSLAFLKEDKINKQNSLATDGTGIKYPTVDAVNVHAKGTGADHTYIDQDVTKTATPTFSGVHFNGASEGLVSWNMISHTLNLETGLGPIIQVGQETLVHVYNANPFPIGDGKAVYPIGSSTNDLPNIGLCIANSHETIERQVGLTTQVIPANSEGFVTLIGTVRDIDTSALSLGSVYISATAAGELTSVEPEFPNYSILMGVVLKSDATTGSIIIDINHDIHDTYHNFWNGTIRESFQIPVTSNGTTITATLSDIGSLGRLTLMFSDGFSTFNTPASINLPAGTATSPILYYIYIPKTTKVLTYSTTGWPVNVEHIKLTTAYIQDAASVQFHGPLNIRYWNDEIEDNNTKQGHLSHIAERIRQEDARYSSGLDFINTVTANSNLISLTSGFVYQMHKTSIAAFNMATGNHIHIANHFTTKFLINTNLATITNNALGVSLLNSSFSFVVWGVVNSGSSSAKIMVNLPIGGYPKNAPATAVSDPDNYSVYTIPIEFAGVAFLIARFTYVREATGEWSLYHSEDLRGRVIGGGAGTLGGGGVTTFAALTDTPSGYIGEANKSVRVAASEAGLEFYTPYYTHTQGVDATTWTVNHGLNRYPSVTIIDSAGTQLYAAVKHIDTNNLTINFNAVTSGIAELI